MYSILQLFGASNGSCGYCKTQGKSHLGTNDHSDEDTSISFGMWAHKMQAKIYQELLDCGWRRSGKYVYKPIMDVTCCPQYTIRLDSQKFYLSRSQKRVLRQMNDFLEHDKKPRESGSAETPCHLTASAEKSHAASSQRMDKSENPVQKKKVMRMKRFLANCAKKGINPAEVQQQRQEKEAGRRRTIESFLRAESGDFKHKLEVRLVAVNSDEFMTRREESFKLYVKYQDKIHDDQDTSFMGYNRFLVHSPLEFKINENTQEEIESDRPPYGSYHQWYILDGKLIAVGVVDILPRCVSSKYMFYDPEYSFLNLGTYTALREIEFSRRLFRNREELRYYYMGYYIPTCIKMKYKGKFQPSELLCDKSLSWVPLSECLSLLGNNDNKFTVFRPDLECTRLTREGLLILLNGEVVPYPVLPHLIPDYQVKETEPIRKLLDEFAGYCAANLTDFLVYVDAIEKLVEKDDTS